MPFIEHTLNSVLRQTYPDIEYIVIDGASTDGTVDAIRRHESGIAKWISEPDAGIGDAFNKGLSLANGDYILILNSDDALATEHVVEEVSRKIAEHNSPMLIYGDCDVLDRQTGVVKYRTNIDYSQSSFHKGRQMLPHPCMFTHQDYFKKYGNFDNQFKVGMDYEWLLRGVSEVSVVHIPMLITLVRDGGVSARNTLIAAQEIVRALEMHGYLPTLASRLYIRAYFTARRAMKLILKGLGLYEIFSLKRHKLNERSS